MRWLVKSLGSSLGRKWLVALTGTGLLLFLIAHMLGNLQVFAGRDALNSYAAQLKSMPELLMVMRLGLLGMAALHVATALKLAAENRAARPVRYAVVTDLNKTTAAKTMVLTGLIIAAFVLFHLAHFTWGWVLTDAHALTETMADGTTRHDAYSMVVAGFQQVPLALLYIVAMLLLGLHLHHGASSVLQTLGLNHYRWAPLFRVATSGLGWLIVAGNVSMPLAVQLGFVNLPAGVLL